MPTMLWHYHNSNVRKMLWSTFSQIRDDNGCSKFNNVLIDGRYKARKLREHPHKPCARTHTFPSKNSTMVVCKPTNVHIYFPREYQAKAKPKPNKIKHATVSLVEQNNILRLNGLAIGSAAPTCVCVIICTGDTVATIRFISARLLWYVTVCVTCC